MKKFNISLVSVVLFAVFSVCSGSVFAEVKIGFVDVAKLSESAPQIRSAQMKMDAEFGGREKELISLQREIENLETALARDGAVMSDSERSRKSAQSSASAVKASASRTSSAMTSISGETKYSGKSMRKSAKL